MYDHLLGQTVILLDFFQCFAFPKSKSNKPYCLWTLKSFIDSHPCIIIIILHHSISWKMMVSRECVAIVDYHFYLFKPTCLIFSTIKNNSMGNIMQCDWSFKYLFQFCYILYSSTRLTHSFFSYANFLLTCTSQTIPSFCFFKMLYYSLGHTVECAIFHWH